ncbi:MAG: hypothetical protein ACLFUJ_03000 [Phycisphaerae bacterium]
MYHTDVLDNVTLAPAAGDLQLRADCRRDDIVVQCYLGGRLTGWQRPRANRVSFILPPAEGVAVGLLAVDRAEASIDYWARLASEAGAPPDRLRIAQPALMRFGPETRWQVLLDGQLRYQAILHPGGLGAGGLGRAFGDAFGFDPASAPGLGHHFGRGEFGFDSRLLTWTSRALPGGSVSVETIVIDPAGNRLAQAGTLVEIQTWPAPTGELAVESYEATTDTLQLSWKTREES